MSEKTEAVNHPKHYNNHPSGIECIEITRHMNFCLGNAFKYVFRHRYKNKPLEDLNKALWYLKDWIARSNFTIINLDKHGECFLDTYAYVCHNLDRICQAEPCEYTANTLRCIWKLQSCSTRVRQEVFEKSTRNISQLILNLEKSA